MFKWQHSESVDTRATSKEIWAIWKDAANWPRWDSELEWVKLKGPFVEGTKGTMKPSGGPVVVFELTNIEKNRQFINCAKLPLTTLEFTHRYENLADGSARIIHAVEMRGLLAPLFGRVIGSKIRAHLRDAMLKLSDLATGIDEQSHFGQGKQTHVA